MAPRGGILALDSTQLISSSIASKNAYAFRLAISIVQSSLMRERLTKKNVCRASCRALGAGALALIGHGGAVITTQMFPYTVETSHYTAGVSLGWSVNTAKADLGIGGTFSMHFASPLPTPGISVDFRLKPTIIDAYAKSGSDGLGISDDEIASEVDNVAHGLSKRYILGFAATELSALALLSIGAKRPRWRTGLATLATSSALLAYQGYVMPNTYNPEHYKSHTFDGLGGSLIDRSGKTIEALTQRSEQIQPYVASWLELEKDLIKPLIPAPEADQLSGPKLLLISDIHGINMYGTIKQLAESNDVDAVIDMGDLLNFAIGGEAEITDLLDGIRSIEKPYIFVLGNHDKGSPADTDLVEKLKKIPNVILLQPSMDSFTVVHVGNVRIAGVNDFMRWFGDSNRDNTEKQKPVVSLFNKIFATDPPDVAISHNPAASSKLVTQGIQIAGHTHKDDVDQSLITIGTFTGGGLFGQFDKTNPEDKPPQQSYGVISFNEKCEPRLLKVSRFQGVFTDEPTLTSVSLHYLKPAVPTPGRSCIDHTLSIETVPVSPHSATTNRMR
jgi:predicted phosphodiesterase